MSAKEKKGSRPPAPKVEILVEGFVAEVSTQNRFGDPILSKNGNKFVTARIYGLDKPLYCFHASLFEVWDTMLGQIVKVRARVGNNGHFTVDLIKIGEQLYKPASETTPPKTT